jgi:hypothetical protein
VKIHLLQLEPLQERYSDWWQDALPNGFASLGNQVTVVRGEPYEAVESGTVLDAFGTNIYKGVQLNKIAEEFRKGNIIKWDRIFVADAWFPGIEMIKYISDIARIPVKTYGVWHAGSITIEDFMAPSHSWAKYFELGFFKAFDGIFVGSEYSKRSVIERLLIPYLQDDYEIREMADKIFPIGLPMNFDHLDKINKLKLPKEKVVLFPSRFDLEKRPNVFMDMIECLVATGNMKNVTFRFCTGRKAIKTNAPWLETKLKFLMDRFPRNNPDGITVDFKYNLTKEEYYTELAKAICMVSCTADETFGYCVAEACALGTVPIVPKAFCYPEILDGHEEFMYSTFEELVERVGTYLKLWDENRFLEFVDRERDILYGFVLPYKNTISQWDKTMRGAI